MWGVYGGLALGGSRWSRGVRGDRTSTRSLVTGHWSLVTGHWSRVWNCVKRCTSWAAIECRGGGLRCQHSIQTSQNNIDYGF